MRRDPTAFRERFKKWKETGEYELPRFAGGKEGYKYVQAGKNNEWSRITDDEMSKAFLDLVVRPLSRGGNTTVGNWKRLWTPKYEKPLENVSPEFDILSLGSGILKEAKRIGTFKLVVKEFTDDPDQIKYSLRDWKGDNKGYIAAHSYDNTPEIGFVKSDIPGGSRALYDAVIKDVTDRGMLGLYSGKELLSAPKTYSVWKHFKDKVLVGNNGLHSNMRMPGVIGEVKWSGDYNKMILNWQNNIYDGTNNGPVYLLKSPSLSLLTLPYIPNMTYLGIPIIGHTISE